MRRHLEAGFAGETDRLMFACPPRHGKSEQNTIRVPAYLIEHRPDTRCITACHTRALAAKFSRRTRSICRDGGIGMSRERYSADDWETQAGGGLRAVGVGGAIAGVGGQFIAIDDPVKSRADAQSAAYRAMCWDWYTDDIVTRLEPGWVSLIVLTMTRWHEDDLAGRILASEEASDWRVVNLPALAEPGDPLGRAEGEALCPERYDERKLDRLRRILGASFYALYQGRPQALEGNIIKREWIRYWSEHPPEEFLMVVQSWDTASKDNEVDNCPSVCLTWGVTRFGHYLLDRRREWLTYPALRAAAEHEAERWKADVVLIEDKGNGTALIQDLRAHTRVPVVEVEPRTDKLTRLASQSTAYEAGLVYHPTPAGAPWVTEFEAQVCAAPNTEYMDDADALSQFLGWARVNAGRFDFESLGGRELAEAFPDGGAPVIDDFTFGRIPSALNTRGFNR